MKNRPLPVAVIAMSGRFPGGLTSPDALWEALREGRDLVEKVPESRWSADRFRRSGDPDRSDALIHASDRGGFLRDIDFFDPLRFGISPREAETLDPAQRLLLACAAECWEVVGIRPSDLTKKQVGVFIGAFTQDYLLLQLGDRRSTVSATHSATGTAQTLLSNRISHCFGLTGPSMTIDTACSSSLVALHLAVSSIRSGESLLSIVGGVQLQLTPFHTAMETRGGFLSADGICKTFDIRADGYVRAEAAAAILLAPLDRAIAENWPIEAVIHGTGINQNGSSAGITQPNAQAQQSLLQATLQQCGINPAELGYVEAHGTGTKSGDLAELMALKAAITDHREKPLLVGSIKTNMGHSEAASGIVSLIKTALCLRHRVIPPNLHWHSSPEGMELDAVGIRIPLQCEPWPEDAPFAGISSFGFGGTNAHAVIGPAPFRCYMARVFPQSELRVTPLLISAPSEAHLVAQAELLRDFLQSSSPDITLSALAAGLYFQRDQASHRLALVDSDCDAFTRQLSEFIRRPTSAEWMRAVCQPETVPQVCWIFAGMGPQWLDMGRELAREFSVFAESWSECDAQFARIAGWSLLERVAVEQATTTGTLLTEIAQPLNLFFQIALAALLRWFGVCPSAFAGHSLGEIAAFHAAGALDLPTAIELVFHRSRLQGSLTGTGGMAAVSAPEEVVSELAASYEVSIAAINGPTAITVAGRHSNLDRFLDAARVAGIYAKRLQVEVPYHCPVMDSLESAFKRSVRHLKFRVPDVALYSTTLARRFETHAEQDFAAYWWKNLREPVRFLETLEAIPKTEARVFLEVSAHPVLASSMLQTLAQRDAVALPALSRKLEERAGLVECLARLHVHGVPVAWDHLLTRPAAPVELPSTASLPRRYWSESWDARALRLANLEFLLGDRRPDNEFRWSTTLPESLWSDHVVLGRPRVPAALILEMLHGAARQVSSANEILLCDIRLLRGVSGTNADLTTIVDPNYPIARVLNEEGSIVAESQLVTSLRTQSDETQLPVDLTDSECLPREQFYELLRPLGFEYGPGFQMIKSIRFNHSGAQAVLAGIEARDKNSSVRILDGALQVLLSAELLNAREHPTSAGNRLPVSIDSLWMPQRMQNCHLPVTVSAVITMRTETDLVGNVVLHSANGELLAELCGVCIKSVPIPSALTSGRKVEDTCYELAWKEWEPRELKAEPVRGKWLVLCTRADGKGRRFADQLRKLGEMVDLATTETIEDGTIDSFLRRADEEQLYIIDVQALDWDGCTELEDVARLASFAKHCTALDKLVSARAEIWVASAGAWDREPGSPAQSGVWAIARSMLHSEGSSAWKAVVDLPQDALERAAEDLLSLIRNEPQQSEFRWEYGAWKIPQLARCESPVAAPVWVRRDGAYLVTGAFGTLGRTTVEYLVNQGARHLILLGQMRIPPRSASLPRSEEGSPVQDRVEWVRSLERKGIRVLAMGFDARSEGGWAEYDQAISGSGLPPVRGIVHAAGVPGAGSLDEASLDQWLHVFGAKVLGLAHLLNRTSLFDLDFLLLYSSIASLAPAYGQAVYAAANLYLQGLAAHLQQKGVAAKTIAWGPWTEGMASDERLLHLFRRQGLIPMTSQEGMRVLPAAIHAKANPVYAAAIDLPLFAAAHRRVAWRLQGLLGAEKAGTSPRFAGRLSALTSIADDPRDIALADLIAAAAEVLRLDPAQMNEQTVLVQLGMDSLLAVELQIVLFSRWSQPLPLSLLLGREPLRLLAEELLKGTRDAVPAAQDESSVTPNLLSAVPPA
jgi:acyl transferase domain-containing protein/short-subunit dehydrogenase